MDTILALQKTSIPNILVISGVVLLFAALIGKFGAFFELDGKRQKWAGTIGILFMLFGTTLFIYPKPQTSIIEPNGSLVEPTPTLAGVELKKLEIPSNQESGVQWCAVVCRFIRGICYRI